MIMGVGDDACFLSSDINALSNHCHEFFTLEDNEIVVIEN
jgi:glucosamine 6-phosphate synthetase-like amidotransferase/phosphosugar isomerase protein